MVLGLEKLKRLRVKKKFHPESIEYKLHMLSLDKKYKRISEYDYDMMLLSIEAHPDSQNYKLKHNEILKKYNKISEYEYEMNKNDLTVYSDNNQHDLNKCEIDLKYNKISQIEYDKQVATINNTPWIKWLKWEIVDGQLEFELDWNQPFIKVLASKGYNQPDENENVMNWVHDMFIDMYEDDDVMNQTSIPAVKTRKEEDKKNGKAVYK